MEYFAVNDSPVWMDSSTSGECRSLEKRMGGAQALANITGSRAYERFSGSQIAKMWKTNRSGYEAAERIALVSSFMASLFACRYAPIDFSDGSGMNLMNIRSRKWDETAPVGLRRPHIREPHTPIRLHGNDLLQERFPYPGACPQQLRSWRLG
jgi:xylulokinase